MVTALAAALAMAGRVLLSESRAAQPRGVDVAGTVLLGLALVGLTPGGSIARLLPGLLVAGAANGVLNAALGRQAVASVPADRAAMGSGANNTARYLGSAIGITVVAVIVTGAGAASGAVGLLSGWNVAALVTAGFSLLGALTVLLARERVAAKLAAPTPTLRAHAADIARGTAKSRSEGPVAERNNGFSGGIDRKELQLHEQ